MPWTDSWTYAYTRSTLKSIASNYLSIYRGLPLTWRQSLISNTVSIAEYKADFDMALNSIGRGHWAGQVNGSKLKDFRHFGRLQKVIICDILGIDSRELESQGFTKIPQLRGYGYYLMAKFLNTREIKNEATRNK